MSASMKTLDLNAVKECTGYKNDPDAIKAMQVVVYVMCGGGFLGHLAAEQPADFYIDDRAGKLPYGKRAILQAVEVLRVHAELAGLNPYDMPPMVRFHNCGIF